MPQGRFHHENKVTIMTRSTMYKTLVTSLLVSTIALSTVSCATHDNREDTSPSQEHSTQDTSPVRMNIHTPHNKDIHRLLPLDKITVSTNKDDIAVTMTEHHTRDTVEGKVTDGSWSPTQALHYGSTYTVTAHSAGETQSWDVSVIKPLTAEPSLGIPDGAQVGVGQTVSVKFDIDVVDKKKMEKFIHVSTTPGVQGDFRWVNNREVRWRPAEFFTPGTRVTVKVNAYGQDLGNGIYGGSPVTGTFTVGPRMVTIVNDDTKTATVWKNNKIIKTFPISLGGNDNPTNNGVYMVGDRNRTMVMDSSTYGVAIDSAQGYKLDVDYATQLSYSGIYLHSAPWAAGAIGSYNQSHGCINALPEDAKWFMDHAHRGDVVIVNNSVGETLPVDDGLGDWNTPLSQW